MSEEEFDKLYKRMESLEAKLNEMLELTRRNNSVMPQPIVDQRTGGHPEPLENFNRLWF